MLSLPGWVVLSGGCSVFMETDTVGFMEMAACLVQTW
jgi:hypothetical protein